MATLFEREVSGSDYEPFDFQKHCTPTDFDSPEVKAEMELVSKQILEVLEGQKIDRSKMLTTFNIEKFCQALPRSGSTMHIMSKDFVRYGVVYGIMAAHYSKPKHQP